MIRASTLAAALTAASFCVPSALQARGYHHSCGGDYYVNVTSGRHVHRPMFSNHRLRGSTAVCRDGSQSFSRHHGVHARTMAGCAASAEAASLSSVLPAAGKPASMAWTDTNPRIDFDKPTGLRWTPSRVCRAQRLGDAWKQRLDRLSLQDHLRDQNR